MHVTIKYHDTTSLTVEEVVLAAQTNYGDDVHVEISPDSRAPHDLIYFALQQILTNKQLELFYDNRDTYQKDVVALRKKVLQDLVELLDTVIIDNEGKVSDGC